MKRRPPVWAAYLLAATAILAQPAAVPDSLSRLDPAEGGQLLAARLRSLAPAEESHFKGVLNIRLGQTRIIPVSLKIAIGKPEWEAAAGSA